MTTSDQIYRAVESQISQRMLLPGDSIDEESLMTQFGVSRTPVREALVRLKSEGLVSSISRGGSIVSKMDVQQLVSVWELLSDLEGLCAGYACERMTRPERQALMDAHLAGEAAAEADDQVGWQQANMAFHEVLYAGSRNTFLRQEILRMRTRTVAYRSHSFGAVGDAMHAHLEHGQIAKAIQERDGETAVRLMRAHLRPEGATLINLLQSLPKDMLR
ncbi:MULTISPECIES: GntR family transcriptional regulator [Cupriavidus]|uniref:GntR family transcriptional regulator n=1 Tax=Cupriavidus TaxID=106589 RepID=UPI00038180D2|nr:MULTISPECIES: GntR family transcriptional regulator [Cupriavidus]